MSVDLDELDKRIIHEICSGIYSYNDLAKTLQVTRNTVYRRIERLEKVGVIKKRIMAIPDFSILGLSAIFFGLRTRSEEREKIVEDIKAMKNTRFIWRAYGDYEIVVVLVCSTGCEGETITEMQRILSLYGPTTYDVSIGFKWERMDITPF